MARLGNGNGFDSSVTQTFADDDSGNIAMIGAFLIPVVLAALGIATDYGRASYVRQQMKLAADQSALAATVSIGNGGTETAAIEIANAQWAVNTVALASMGVRPSVSVGKSGGQATARVSFQTSLPTTFSRIMGVQSLEISGVTSTEAKVTSITPTKFSGNGSMWGDPHLVGADGNDARFACPSPSWFNMLSDGGVEVNISCFHNTVGPYPNTDIISDMSVVLGTHTISIHQGPPNPDMTWPRSRLWLGEVTIDGEVYDPSSTKVLANWPQGTVTAIIGDGGDPTNQTADNITISTPQYTIVLNYEYNNGGAVAISAANAGTCGAPGGLWGETLAGINDTKLIGGTNYDAGTIDPSAFAVPTAVSTAPEFKRSPCSLDIASKVKFSQ